jgi:hypothetical protein
MRPLAQGAIDFRSRVIGALDRFGYIDQDTCTGACPVCGGVLSVYFHGTAPRADLRCRGGCTEQEVVNALTTSSGRTA